METTTEIVKTDQNGQQNPANLIQIAIEKGASIETIERLMALEEKWRANKAKELYSIDFVKMKPLLPLVARTKSNSQTKSKYAPLEEVNKMIDKLLSEYGFATATKITAQTVDSVTIEAELWHSGGHVEKTSITLPLDDKGMQGTVNKTKLHATASTVTYGKRIAICALLNISTGDDTDGSTPQKTKAESAKMLEEAKKIILRFKTATEINVNYKQIIKDAETEGISPEHVKELQDFINSTYKAKKNATDKK